MNAEKFWSSQLKKNQSGKPKFVFTTDPGTPDEELMASWIEKWHEHFSYFSNEGCGCCINFYEFDSPEEAVAELPDGLVTLYEEQNHQPVTSTQSTFKNFVRSTTK